MVFRIPGVVFRVAAITPFHFFWSFMSTKDLATDAIPEARASIFSAGLSPSKIFLEGPVTVAILIFPSTVQRDPKTIPDGCGLINVPSHTDHSTLFV
jgi:hypothetical protein